MQFFLSGEIPSTEEIVKALGNFGFYNLLPDVTRMFAEYTNHGHLGYAGGVMDQPEEYWHDMTVMRWLRLWVEHVSTQPRMEQIDVFERLRQGGDLSGNWIGGGNG